MKKLFTLLSLFLCFASGAWAIEQDTDGYYLIGSVQDWKDFAGIVNTYPAANAKMTADIDLGDDQTMVGTSSVPYQGSFDGQGHTLKVAYNTSESNIAPFRYVAGSTQTIENLHVNGTIYTTGCSAGGVVCSIAGNLTIKKCWVSAQIRTQSAGGSYGTIGGICSYCDPTENCTIVIEDCLFSGAILYSSYCGSFMSHVASSKSSVTIRRGLSIGTWSGGDGYQSGTFIRPVLNGIRNIENAFYRYSCGEVQGTHATDEELADGTIATALQNDRAETVWVQDATSGQPRLDVFNHPVTPTSQIINLSELTADYIAQDGDVLTGTTSYSIQIAADATITLSNVTITNWRKSPIQCLGNATINIEDGSVNNLRDSDEDSNSYGRPALAFGPSGTTLTINGNTGRLIAIGGRLSSAIGCRDNRVAYGGLIINGGVISAHGNSSYTSGIGAVGADDSHGSYCGDITINGGTINVAASDGIGIGAAGANSCGAITINGGTIISSAVRSIAIGGNCSKVVINGGDINASTTTGVGIGGSGVVYIEGGTIVASASDWEGVGISGDKGVLIRSSITSLTASKGPYGANAIQGGTVYISANLNDVTEGNTRTLTPKASFEPESDLVQDGAGYYLIADVTNWKEFAILSQIETSPKGKLVADINLGDEQAMIGSFNGIFDGQGHTLTVNLTSTANVCGVFRYVADGATIQNLRIAGTINGAHRWIGGFVGEGTGTYYINNCISSVTINTTYSGDGVQGGFVAAQRGTLYMNDCIFDGVFNGPNAYTWGGFVGWYYGGSTLTNCLVLCDEYNVKMSDVATFIAMSGTLNNCYYKTPIGTAQGTQATAAELADGTTATALQAGRAEEVWVQDPVNNLPMLKLFANAAYTVPSSGIGTFSAKAKFAVPDGLTAHYCKTYNSANGTIGVVDIDGVVPANTGVLLKGTPGETYTLTGTNNEAATVTDNALIAVVEATHVDQTVGEYTNFMMSGGKFVKIAASSNPDDKIPANRAYLPILTSALPTGSGQSITLNWDEETGVKAVRNAQFMVNSYYTLDGRKLDGAPSKGGVYINNGKKVIK